MEIPSFLPSHALNGADLQRDRSRGALARLGPWPARGALVGLAGVALAACAHVAAPAPDVEPEATLRCAAWNVLHDDRDLGAVVALAREVDADVIGFSEVTADGHDALARALGDTYPHRAHHDELALLSRLPFVAVARVAADVERKPQLVVTLATARGPVDLALVHYIAPTLDAPHPAGVWASLARAEAIHAEEVRTTLRHLTRDRPRIVMGDMNTLSFHGTRARLLDDGLVDVAAAADGPLAEGTWGGTLFGVPARLRIDYLFASPDLRARAVRVVPSPASDHALLFAELALPSGQTAPGGRARQTPRRARMGFGPWGQPAMTRTR